MTLCINIAKCIGRKSHFICFSSLKISNFSFIVLFLHKTRNKYTYPCKTFRFWHIDLANIKHLALQNVVICKLIQQLFSSCHIHHFHHHLAEGSEGTSVAKSAYTLGRLHKYTLSRLVRWYCPSKVHHRLSNPSSFLPVSPLTPLSSLGPLKVGRSSSDRTTLTAHQPKPDTFLKAEPGWSQCSHFPFILFSVSHSLFEIAPLPPFCTDPFFHHFLHVIYCSKTL